jgi:hypothetical protein
MRRLAPLAAALAGVAAFAGPAAADIRFEGRTSDGRQALVVAEDDGVPKRGAIWWRADCREPGYTLRGATGFSRPLDLSTRRRFRDAGTYKTTTPNGERLTVFARTRGRKVGPRRWVGRFGARIVARRRGRVVDRCSVSGVRWQAVRVRR